MIEVSYIRVMIKIMHTHTRFVKCIIVHKRAIIMHIGLAKCIIMHIGFAKCIIMHDWAISMKITYLRITIQRCHAIVV